MNVKQYTLHIWQSIWWKDVSFYDVKSIIQICKKLLWSRHVIRYFSMELREFLARKYSRLL